MLTGSVAEVEEEDGVPLVVAVEDEVGRVLADVDVLLVVDVEGAAEVEAAEAVVEVDLEAGVRPAAAIADGSMRWIAEELSAEAMVEE